MPRLHTPNQNHLIAALPTAEFERLNDALELVPMMLGEVLYEPGTLLPHAYFPTTAVISLYSATVTGAAAETTGVGREGMVGMALFMGGDTTPSSAVVLTSGHGYRLPRSALMRAFEGPGQMRRLLLRYTQALITQITQAAVCYRHHSIEQQLSRWLLSTADRSPAGELVMTQELVASMLGMRRESVTQAAGGLQEGGYIRYRRGHITVIDPIGLQTCACECYGVVKHELHRLLTETRLRQDDTAFERPSAGLV
ncbi:cAMP-binding protein [Thiomonas sp. X19]|uniref:Crp/Fnr family transcriptional regulator n=1 Tax=Thiomonas sp. X19 TaxID=1050370 RepID=UPI000B672F11|nr:Crp/Fnr family transcriptional regulator [Thiomonas sp. X19]SCC95385.1 cAMP-binding protein [Thiomonas sp. X19]